MKQKIVQKINTNLKKLKIAVFTKLYVFKKMLTKINNYYNKTC